MLVNAILRLVFAGTVFHKRAILLIINAKYTESWLDFRSYPESTLNPPWFCSGKIFEMKVQRRQEMLF